jgi:hypothetical protein
MATLAVGAKNCAITIGIFSGARQPFSSGEKVLLTVRDGNQQQVFRDYINKPGFTLSGLPFHNNFADNYTVVAWAKGYAQAGFTPVKVSPAQPAALDLMLMREDAQYNFSEARWGVIRKNPRYATLLAAGAASLEAARDRYMDVFENRSVALACFFNLATAMAEIHLPVGSPLDYIRELIWDITMTQDRFFAWADRALVDQVVRASANGLFAPEPGTAVFHPGATRSYKQVQFGEANVQLTFHENDTRTIDGTECIKLEPDIDYYRDLAAHALLEVAANTLTGSATDPRQVYVLRWMAGRHAGVAEFAPPYHLE